MRQPPAARHHRQEPCRNLGSCGGWSRRAGISLCLRGQSLGGPTAASGLATLQPHRLGPTAASPSGSGRRRAPRAVVGGVDAMGASPLPGGSRTSGGGARLLAVDLVEETPGTGRTLLGGVGLLRQCWLLCLLRHQGKVSSRSRNPSRRLLWRQTLACLRTGRLRPCRATARASGGFGWCMVHCQRQRLRRAYLAGPSQRRPVLLKGGILVLIPASSHPVSSNRLNTSFAPLLGWLTRHRQVCIYLPPPAIFARRPDVCHPDCAAQGGVSLSLGLQTPLQ